MGDFFTTLMVYGIPVTVIGMVPVYFLVASYYFRKRIFRLFERF